MTEINLANKRAVIVGPPGSGKTVLARHILNMTRQHIVWDPLQDYIGYNRYQPTNPHSKTEADQFIRKAVIGFKPRLFVFEEANNIIEPKPKPLPPAIREMNDWSRHYGISWIVMARRPVQLHTDVVELATFIFAFRLTGKNDRAFFDNYNTGLGDIVATLKPWHFLVIEQGVGAWVHDPIPDDGPKWHGLDTGGQT